MLCLRSRQPRFERALTQKHRDFFTARAAFRFLNRKFHRVVPLRASTMSKIPFMAKVISKRGRSRI